jgi:hypothetical protein
MNKKSNLFHDQSSSSRIERIKQNTLDTIKLSNPQNLKNNTDKNSTFNALARVRNGGYIVPPKISSNV